MFEIGANVDSFKDNLIVTGRISKVFNRGLSLTSIGIIIALALLLTNVFWKPEKVIKPTKVELINIDKMDTDNKNNTTNPPVVIPSVPPRDRERIQEGKDKPPPPPRPQH